MLEALASRIMARTTIDLDPAVLRELKARGAQEGRSLGAVASDLLAAALKQRSDAVNPPDFRWQTASLGVPLVDLEDREAVRRVLDEQ